MLPANDLSGCFTQIVPTAAQYWQVKDGYKVQKILCQLLITFDRT